MPNGFGYAFLERDRVRALLPGLGEGAESETFERCQIFDRIAMIVCLTLSQVGDNRKRKQKESENGSQRKLADRNLEGL